jgi:hypothetical protein
MRRRKDTCKSYEEEDTCLKPKNVVVLVTEQT